MSLSVKAQLAFLPKTSYATGISPGASARADFNRDGNLDFVTGNIGGNFSIFLGHGDGSFQPRTDYPTLGRVEDLITGDFNGDAKEDIIVSITNNNSISVFTGDGTGAFNAAITYTVGLLPNSLAAADFNGDGKADLVVANASSSNCVILPGNGNGTFQPQQVVQQFVASQRTSRVCTGDFNGDNKEDLVVTTLNPNATYILKGRGDGTFQPVESIFNGGDPQFIVKADFNKDGREDLAVGNHVSSSITVMLGNGNGTFTSTNLQSTPSSLIRSIQTDDFNKDGVADLVTGTRIGMCYVHLGKGDGTFGAGIGFGVTDGNNSVTSGDFNKDGLPDLIVPSVNLNDVSVLINTISPDANGVLYVKKGASGNGASWAGALGELAVALKTAVDINALSPGKVKQIWVAQGTYIPMYNAADGQRDQDAGRQNSFVLVKDVKLYGGFSGTETSLTSRNWNLNKTILSGELQNDANMANNAYHVVISSGDAGTGLIDGFRISEGSPIEDYGVSTVIVNGNELINRVCGGLYNRASSLLVKNCVFSKNTGQSGIAFYNSGGNPVLMNVLMYGNYNLIYSGVSFVSISGNPSLINTTIAGNTSSHPVAVAAGNAKMYNSVVSGNTNFSAFTFDNIDIKNSIVQGYTGGTGNLDADPLFNNAASGDFTLKLGSPAINKGGNALYELADQDAGNNSLGTDKDLTGATRFLGSSIDMGAYERIAPDLQSATYDVATHVLKVTGTNFEANPGALNDVNVNALALSGQGGQIYTLTSANVELSNTTSFSVVLNTADQHGLDNIINKNGLASTDGTTYNLAAADGWLAAVTYNADLAGNSILVSGNRAPAAVNDQINVVTNTPATGNVLTNDSDRDGNALTASLVTAPVNGTVVFNADGSFTFSPNNDFIGKDSLHYQVCDNGIPSLCDSAWVYYDVKPLIPVVTSVSVPANGYYKSGDMLIFTADFSENVTVNTTGGTPFLSLTIGAQSRQAAYIGGSGSSALTFSHTVQPGDVDLDGIVLGTALTLNGGTIQNSAAKNALTTLNNVGNTSGVLVYSAVPSVVLSSTAPALLNQPFTVTAAFSEAVTGFTVADLTITNATAGNLQTSDNITYTLLVTPVADGAVGLHLPVNRVANIAGQGNTISNTLNFTYDTTAPAVNLVSVPSNAIYKSGAQLDFTLRYSENVIVNTAGGTPAINLTIGSTARQAVYVSGSGTNLLTFRYTVANAELDLNGISLGTNLLLNGATIRDAAGNNIFLGLQNIASTTGVLVDAVAPAVSSVTVPANGYYKTGNTLSFTVNYSENVTVNTSGGVPTLGLLIGSQNRNAVYVSGSATSALLFSYTVQATDTDLDGIALNAALKTNGGTIQDMGLNDALPALNNVGNTSGVLVYSAVPTVVLSSTAPALLNQPFTVTAAFSEAVTGFAVVDLTTTNATAGNLQTSDNITYTLLVTPSADGLVSISLPAGKVVNIAGSGNTASNALNFSYDGTAPAAPVVIAVPNGATILTSTAAISGTAEANSRVAVYLDAQLVNAAITVDASGNWTYTSAILNDGLHTVNAKAKDAVGNESPVSNTNTFRINTASTISTSGTLNALATTYGTVSSSAQFMVSGTNMTSGILITAPAGFELSTNNINFSNTVTAGASGTISGTVYLRLKSTANAGSYSGNIVLSSPGATDVNLATAVCTVNKALLTIKANNEEKFAGTANPVFSAGYTGFVNGETAAVLSAQAAFTTAATTESPAGTYDINVSGASAVNYNITYVKGVLTIKPGAPTEVSLAAVTLYENQPSGANAGTLASVSADPSANFNYTLVAGAGDADNALFAISGNKINTAASLDYENKQVYKIRVRSTTQNNLWLEKELSINPNDVNEAPTLNAIANQPICYTIARQTVSLSGMSAGPEAGQTITLSASSSNPGLFEDLAAVGNGATGSLNYRIKNGASGTATITVTVKDNGGTANGGTDTYIRTFDIEVNALPVIAISSDKGPVVSKGETVQITATGATSFLWAANGSILNGLNTAFITVRPTETTTYTVTGKNASGCIQVQSFTLTVQDDYVKLKANNILTPNNDGYNDKWVVENIDVYPENEVKVFDKSGRLVYAKKGYDNSWDGTLNGTALNEDTYYYIIDFGKSRPKFKGYITLIRESK